jgi:hypothetical protein
MPSDPSAAERSPTRVLFIAGAGRSGSTILDNILGNVGGLVSVGELRYVWERGMLEDRLCGCGERFSACPVWQAVLEEAFGGPDGVDARRMMHLQAQATRIRQLPLALGPARLRRRLDERLEDYLLLLGRLYDAVARVTGARVVVDSSKLPTYGRLVDVAPGVDLTVVHLVRDPRATAFSWQRKKRLPDRQTPSFMQRQGPAKAALLWSVWNATAERLWSRRPARYLRIRYEDFMARPMGTVERIVSAIGEPADGLPFVSETEVELARTHTVAGNPSRFSTGVVELRPDDAWEAGLSTRHRSVVTALTWPLLRRYGYPLQTRRRS